MIRFGIVGAGGIAHKFARDIKLSDNASLVAIASRTLGKAQVFQKEHNIEHAFGSYKELAESGLIDAVYIATPHSHHLEHSTIFLHKKIHVLCEKPITVNKHELEQMIAIAEDNNVLLMEAMWSRFLPSLQHIEQYLSNNQDFTQIELNFGYQLDKSYSKEGRLLNPNLAGGATLDLGVYPVSIMKFLTSKEIKTIHAIGQKNDDQIDMDMKVDIEFTDGSKALLHSSMLENLDYRSYIKYDDKVLTIFNTHHSQSYSVDNQVFDYPCIGEGFVHQINAFTNTLDNNLTENNVMTHHAMLEVMELLDEIRRQIDVKYPFE